ncbi:MAG: DUF2156 domain-containing protein [Candidatus Aminicenantes bacterium]|nr:DUF2156 domain-containing protein [Candidatus Aminicenantes bacterium]
MSVPDFPSLKPLGLEDRALVDDSLTRFPPQVCELNFANLFIWRSIERPRLTFNHGHLCILVEPPGQAPFVLPPVGPGPFADVFEAALTLAPRLSRVPDSMLGSLGPGFRTEPDPDNSDYVYKRSDLADLKGKKYDGKRNRIRKFEGEHAYRPVGIGPGYLVKCRCLLDEWLEAKEDDGWNLEAQQRVVTEALLHFRELGLKGIGIEVEGRLAAFAIGSLLNPETALCMIEVVNPAFDGLAQLVNREFARNAWPGVSFINREQDMGIEGLRRAKRSYYPDHLVPKYNVSK